MQEIKDDNEKDINKINKTNENNEIKQVKKHKYAKILYIIIGIFAVFILSFLIFACVNRFNTKVYSNIYLLDKNVSNMNHEQIISFLNNLNDEYKNNSEINVVQNDKNIYTIKPENINYSIDVTKTAENILEIGRSSNVFKNNFVILKTFFSSKVLTPVFNYDNTMMQDTLKNVDLSLDNRYVDDTYSVDDKTNTLIITKGKTGNSIDYNSVSNDILKLLSNKKMVDYDIKTIDKKPNTLNIDNIYNSIKKEPKDAYVDKTTEPIKFVKEEEGIDFNKDDLVSLLAKDENNQEGKTIEFKLNITEPKVKLKDLTYMFYNDKISECTTYFDPTQSARANNIALALQALNGVIVMPSQTFSYNAIVGDTTAQKGYLPAATFKGGKVVQEYGGGICQTVSTLYDTALLANLEIVERHQHGLPVGYIKPSLDATVYGDVLDLKFKNTRTYPIKIVTSYSKASGSMNISIYGTKEDTEYQISLTSKYLYTIPFNTTYTYDNTITKDQQQVVSKGVNGYASEGYITKSLNGKVISTTLLSKDVYNPEQQVVKVGTLETNQATQ